MISISEKIQQHRQFFQEHQTQSYEFRLDQLQILKNLVLTHQIDIIKALHEDLHKCEFEAYASEINIVLQELNYALKHLRNWIKPSPRKIPFLLFPAAAQIVPEPLGVVLILGAWNYPFQLMILPLIGAIASGNCVVLKPSEFSTATSHLLAELIGRYFDSAYLSVIEGAVDTAQALLAERFDHICFTGSTRIGKLVMAAAAQSLTPVTLELGGKNPCIVDRNTDIACTARRIVWGRFMNAGQSCVAPDYVLVDRSIQTELLDQLKLAIQEQYGTDPAQSPDYGRIINAQQVERLAQLLASGVIVMGGEFNPDDRYMAPTILNEVSLDAPIMEEEIFGPILPIIPYDQLQDAIGIIQSKPKPLAVYCFSNCTDFQQKVMRSTSSGSMCVNDTILQITLPELPFGGVGFSGYGRYKGKAGFDTFSNAKSVLKRSFFLDLKVRYAPYKGKLPLFKLLTKF